VAEKVRGDRDPIRRLQHFFEAGFAFVERHPAQAKVMITILNGSDAEFKDHVGRLYQPMFELVANEILAPGVEQRLLRQVDLTSTARLLMTIYLGTSSQVDEKGKPYLDARQVADFAIRALLYADALEAR